MLFELQNLKNSDSYQKSSDFEVLAFLRCSRTRARVL